MGPVKPRLRAHPAGGAGRDVRRANTGGFRFAAVFAISAATACAELPPRQAADADGPPEYGGTLVLAGPSDLTGLNSLTVADVWTAEVVNNLIFMTPLRLSEDLLPEPYLARSWEWQGDTAVVFHLRDDIYWHDGVRTTAHDLAFTFRRAKDPRTAFPNAREYFGSWHDVEVVDSFSVRFRLDPHADPLVGWSATAVMPRHLLGAVPAEQLRQAEFNRQPVGNGPFRFVSYRANDRWIFEANPDFPEELGGRPYVDRLVWRVIPESTAAVTELMTGQVDVITNAPSERLRELDAHPRIRAVIRPSRVSAAIVWNGLRPPFDDPRVRRALAMAIDREEVLQALRGGYGELAIGPIPPAHWAFAREYEPLPFDPAAARGLLAEAGFRVRPGSGTLQRADGRELRFALTVPAGDFNRNLAEKFQADLAAIGVRMDIRSTDAATMGADITAPERRFDAVLIGWETGFRLDLRDQFHSRALGTPFQLASYADPGVDEVLEVAPLLTDRDAALPHWHRLQAILLEEQPWTFLYYYPDLFAVRDRVRGVRMDVRGRLLTAARWWLSE